MGGWTVSLQTTLIISISHTDVNNIASSLTACCCHRACQAKKWAAVHIIINIYNIVVAVSTLGQTMQDVFGCVCGSWCWCWMIWLMCVRVSFTVCCVVGSLWLHFAPWTSVVSLWTHRIALWSWKAVSMEWQGHCCPYIQSCFYLNYNIVFIYLCFFFFFCFNMKKQS